MSDDDYLWDRGGPPDPEIVALERALAGVDPADEMPRARVEDGNVVRLRSRVVTIAIGLAALLVVGLGGWWWSSRPIAVPPSPIVKAPDDAPIAAPDVASPVRVPAPWIETGTHTSRTIEVASLGHVELDPGTRLRPLEGAPGEYRYELERGRIHAKVDAPPRIFVVETPSAVAVDLGCQYTLEVDAEGSTRLEVSVGFVALERGGRECIVPAGAGCDARDDRVGTTVRLEASAAVKAAVIAIDRGAASERAAALATVLREATASDLATLWHLLRYASVGERPPLFDRLADLTVPPDGVTRDAVLAGDDAMLLAWWDHLGLGRRGFRSPGKPPPEK